MHFLENAKKNMPVKQTADGMYDKYAFFKS